MWGMQIIGSMKNKDLMYSIIIGLTSILLVTFISGCKNENKKLAFNTCRDSVLSIPQKTNRSTGKIFLDYNFGNTLKEFNVASFLLRRAGKIDDSNHYIFQHPALEILKFSLSPSFHNDSLRSLKMYNWDRYGKNGEQTFYHLSIVLSNKFDKPICQCENQALWIKEDRFIEADFDEKNIHIDIQDLNFAKFYHKNFSKVIYSTDLNSIGNTYEEWYQKKYVNKQKAKIQKVENDKASKDF